jgi:hypothetical protein
MREKLARMPVITHRYQGKRYLTLDGVDQILKYQRGEIEKGLLTDEEITHAIISIPDVAGVAITRSHEERAIAQVQLQKVLKALEEK